MNPLPPPFEARYLADDAWGQLLDIKVPEAKQDAWAVFLARIPHRYPHRFVLNSASGEVLQAIPDDTRSVLALAGSDAGPWPGLSMNLLGLDICVHFFDPGWLELSASRSDLTVSRYDAVTQLMCSMGDEMALDVFMTPESDDCESHLVYEAAARRFRRPRQGGPELSPTERLIRDGVMQRLRSALAPFELRAARWIPGALGRSWPDIEMLRAARAQIEAIQAEHRELELQDVLTLSERRDLAGALQLLASILSPPGTDTARYRDHYVSQLADLARRI